MKPYTCFKHTAKIMWTEQVVFIMYICMYVYIYVYVYVHIWQEAMILKESNAVMWDGIDEGELKGKWCNYIFL